MIWQDTGRLLVVVALASGCSMGARTPNREAPTLARLEPATVRIRDGQGAPLTVHGVGFDGRANTIAIGPVQLGQVPSTANGTRIDVVIPDRVTGQGGAPPALWERGTVMVTVTTTRGTSNALALEVVPEVMP